MPVNITRFPICFCMSVDRQLCDRKMVPSFANETAKDPSPELADEGPFPDLKALL